ncbi:MAG TPA: methyltransferase domain-containing protein [Rhizomicrobium sp.]|jgi:SAM-dependent methyltransferase|nr:methyltransferase domain-containing protein [Rhizomicrobium sp.]
MPVGFVVTSADATETDNPVTAPVVFDRGVYALRRLRAEQAEAKSFLVRHAAENLSARLTAVKRRFNSGLELNSRGQSFEILAEHAEHWVRTSLHPRSNSVSLVGDEEFLPFAAHSFDLVVSTLGLHAANDLPGALLQIQRSLRPDGLFMAAMFGGATLNELRRAFASGEAEQTGGVSPRVAPFADVRDAGALLQRAGFALPVADVDRIAVHYGSFATLVDDLHNLGETNALAQRRRSFLRRGVLSAALASYACNDAQGGKLAATFDVLYLTGWAPEAMD